MKDNLFKCVEALKDVRRNMQDDADPGIVAALSEAIAELEGCVAEDGSTQPDLAEAALGALAVISEIIVCLNGIAELVQHFRA